MAKKSSQQGIFPDGTRVRMKSGTQGWVEGVVVQYYDVIPVVGGMMYGGGLTPGYEVKVHRGEAQGSDAEAAAQLCRGTARTRRGLIHWRWSFLK